MPAASAKSWDELARAIVQNILENQGGVVAILPFLSLLFVLIIIGMAGYVLHQKQKEIDRMAVEKSRLEDIILKSRLSSQTKRPKRKGQT
jgi:hypothetical protein